MIQLTLKKHLLRFQHNQQGSAVIEFLFSIIILLSILFFMIDLSLIRENIGKLDNTSYSLVSLLRERKLLYADEKNPNQPPTILPLQEDVNTYTKLAKHVFYGKDNDPRELYVVLSVLYDDGKSQQYKQLSNKSACQPAISLNSNEMKTLSPVSKKTGKRFPIYQVTVCVPAPPSLFKSFLSDGHYQNKMLVSSSISLSR